MPVIEVAGLRKAYGDLRAVDDLTFSVAEREVVAILGPNGAGKTTTVEILEGYRRRDGGTVSVLGMDPEHGGRVFRERIGIVLQEAGFEDEFTVRELLRLQAGFYPSPRPVDDTIAMVGLEDKAGTRVRALSGGQRRRLDLALGVIGSPDVLFLDEPTTGFDPSARRRAWELVDRLRDLGTTILLTTHYMDEAEHLADRVLVLARGGLVAEGRPEDLAAAAGAATLVCFRLPAGTAAAELPPLALPVTVTGREVEVRSTAPTADVHRLTGWALERGLVLEDLRVSRPDLEQVYLQLVDERSDAAPADADGGRGSP